MSYFSPYVDATGLHLPTYNDILEKRIEDAKNIFGQDIYLGNDSLDYQIISSEALGLSEAMQAIQFAYNQCAPSTSIGVGLSSLVQLNGITRRPASYSTCDVTLTGTSAVTITNGVVVDVSGYKWDLPSPITLVASGSPLGSIYELTVTAVCQTSGAIGALPGDISIINTTVAGWTDVNNVSAAIPGLDVESDSALRERQRLSVTKPSMTMLSGTIAAIAELENVTRYKIYENATNSTSYGDPGVPFEGAPAHSITCIVEGGVITDIAQAIYDNRGLGCYTNGDVETDITDLDYGTVTPIRFYRPTYVPVYVVITIHEFSTWADEYEDDIKAAIVAYIDSLSIGESLAASSVIAAAVSSMADLTKPSFSIRSLEIGIAESPLVTTEIDVDYNEVVQGDLDLITIIKD